MAEIINLNRARKARGKAADKARAEANRAAFGRSKKEIERKRIEYDRLDRSLDGARRERPEEDQT